MSVSNRLWALPALLVLVALGAVPTTAQAQRILYQPSPLATRPQMIPYRVNPNAFLGAPPTAQQALFNSRVIGRSIANIPPYAFGFNPFPSPIISSGPVVPINGFPSPSFGLSTVPGFASGATLSTSPYGLSTTGGFGGGYGGGYGYDPFGYYPPPYAAALQGLASYTSAAGQYWVNIGQARLLREQSRQASMDTLRKRVQLEAYLESMRLTAPQMREREAVTELDRARKDPPAVEVWSGRSLNELLRSIQRAGRANFPRGPQVSLDDIRLDNIHLTDRAVPGNVGLLKQVDREGKLALTWPAALETGTFAETTKRLSENLAEAVNNLRSDKRPPMTTIKDIQADFATLERKLNDGADELSPAQYIEARRYLRQLEQAIRVLRDPRAANSFNDTWKAQGKTVAELVDNMTRNGLEFAPAAPGDEASYTALFHALRAFEAGLQVALSTKGQ